MVLKSFSSTYQGVKRLREISAVFIRHGFRDIVAKASPAGAAVIGKRNREEVKRGFSTAKRVRLAFEELGPTFVKLGQMLSLEPDIIPAEFVEEFKKLQDDVPPFGFDEVRAIIEVELGDKPEAFFRRLDPTPIAAASVSQVHFAELISGEYAAVKVQRPNIEKIIKEDIKILKKVAGIIEKKFENLALLNPTGIVDEFEDFISKELDFTTEAANIERFIRNFKDDKTLCVPRVYWEETTHRILTMEYLDGMQMDELEKIRASGLDLDKIAQKGLSVFAKQILVHGFFHADPHPGNALVMPDGRVGLIDFGIVGFIEQRMMRQLAGIFVGYAEHDYDRVIQVLADVGLVGEGVEMKAFRRDLIALSEPFYGRSLKYVKVKDVFDKVLSLVVKHRIRLQRDLILLFKTLIAMEGVGRRLSPDANILEAMRPYAERLLAGAHDPRKIMGNLRYDMFNYLNLLKDSPEHVHSLLKNMAAGNQNIKLSHTLNIEKLEDIERSFVSGSNRIAMAIVTGTAVLAGSMILASEHQVLPIDLPFLGLVGVPVTTILGLVGYSVATVLGIWLVFSIFFVKK